MISYRIHVYSSSSDILKKRINAGLPIVKNDLIFHSWVTHGIDKDIFRYMLHIYEYFYNLVKLKWKIYG